MARQGNGAIVVTGASGGIGREIVERLAAKGMTVFAAVRSKDSLGGPRDARIIPVQLDVTDAASVAEAARQIAASVGARGLQGLVNNAGLMIEGPLDLQPVRDVWRQFEVNVLGPVALTKALLPLLRAGRGRIVNVGAVTAHTPVPFFGAIAASKAALASLTETMRMEFAPLGVEVSLVEPGAIQTTLFDKSRDALDAAVAAADPAQASFYAPAIAAIRGVMAKSPSDKPSVVAAAIVNVLLARNPPPRTIVGKGARQLVFLSYLPLGLRGRLLMSSLGLAATLKDKPRG